MNSNANLIVIGVFLKKVEVRNLLRELCACTKYGLCITLPTHENLFFTNYFDMRDIEAEREKGLAGLEEAFRRVSSIITRKQMVVESFSM